VSAITPSPAPSAALSRLTTIAALLSLAVVGAASQCGPCKPVTAEDLRKQSTTLQRADKEGYLRVGIQDGLPLMSKQDPGSGRWSGFDAEIARFLATELGYTQPDEVRFIPLTTEQRISALQGDEVDIVVADFTITEERRKHVRFAGPYLITTPEVMIRAADRDKIRSIDDLREKKVCTTGGSTSAKVLEKLKIPFSPVTRGRDCAQMVLDGTADAQCTDEVVIAGFVHEHPTELYLLNLPFTDTDTEPLGVGIQHEDEALEKLIGQILRKQWELRDKSQWQAAYNASLGQALGTRRQPQPQNVPDPNACEKAALGRRRD
jgi:glutamate transport system substrate-binding protein